ncbi:hypothetical protein QYE76_006600 [Lolium multiflorum]|uniref:RING-type domain-containing protein n=1 Tax=Lolium multiflorum TaxID=4521 RepID=A0AAD8RV51_LOLMU|nr:hypothetical protein QYE76_006600 [Lolium multiflorum]
MPAAAAAPLPPRALRQLQPSQHFKELHRLRQDPVCLGAFQLGDTVRLLPVCLHLYHMGCIDPWLDAHSTDTVPTMVDVVSDF